MDNNLQEIKLQLEIEELKKKWYQKTDLLKVLLPTVLAIFSLIYAIVTGFFSSKSELLELKKQQLQFEISQFQKEKTLLIELNHELENKRSVLVDSLQKQDNKLNNYEMSLIDQQRNISTLNNQLVVLKNTRQNYNQEISDLETEYESKKKIYLKELETKYFQEIDYNKKLSVKSDSISILQSRIQDLEYNREALLNSPFIKKKDQFEFQSWANNIMLKYFDSLIEARQKEGIEILKSLEKTQNKLDSLDISSKLIKMN